MDNLPPSTSDPLPAAPASLLQAAPLAEPAPAVRTAAQRRFAVRMWCILILTLCASMLGVGLYLQPDKDPAHPLQTGTHEQLGLPPCGFYRTTGVPCPTCGCTTAVSRVAHGHILRGLATQPFGGALGILAIVLLPLSAFGLATGRWLGPQPFTIAWYWQSILVASILLLLLAWGYKIIFVKYGIALF